jgi:ubiquinone/menaquinone biosynthesis C-methylase UbiE
MLSITKAAYLAQHKGMLFPALASHQVLRFISRQRIRPDPDAILEVRRRFDELLRRDLENVEHGFYPASLLFGFPYGHYAKNAPALAIDVPRVIRRMWSHAHVDLPDGIDLERYPKYFRRNFHWQTDGYFSRESARRYDVGVELLFLGTADVMRRQILPPITRLTNERGNDLRLLDVGCGTGRTLLLLSKAHPKLRFTGLDLSPYYLQFARDLLKDVEYLSLVPENAEAMPFRDDHFDVLTSVHMFHELPRSARRTVYREMFRVLAPGGLLVIEDSGQATDSARIAFFLEQFSKEFHEPYHADYVRDDIATALADAGFEVESSEAHFVSKVVVARKPA